MGELDNTIVVFTTDNGAETQTFPDGGITPFKGRKLTTWEGGMRAPCVIRWPGVIKPGTVFKEMFSSLDWVPTFVEIAGGAKGNELNEQIMEGKYPGHREDQARRRQPARLPPGQVRQVGARYLLLLPGPDPLGGALQELEVLLHDDGLDRLPSALGAPVTFHWTQLQNIMRDPFETERRGRSEVACCPSAAHWPPRVPRISTTGTSCPSASCCG